MTNVTSVDVEATSDLPGWEDVLQAAERIAPYAHQTPVLTCQQIDDMLGACVFFKCENLQKVGAFKFRGACNVVFSLSEEEARCGVATHSSGNHAAALALAALRRGIPAHVVMPADAPEVKKRAVAGYGASITFCEPTLEARVATLRQVQQETGAIEVHPYDHPGIIAGQATAAKELIEAHPGLDIVMAPVGGGGLLAGTALATRTLLPQAKVIAAEPTEADDAFRSWQAGKWIPSTAPNTIADGLKTSLGQRNFAMIVTLQMVDRILTLSEEAIISAMRLVWERMKLVIEPSSALPLAALLTHKDELHLQGKRIGLILSGGNVDLARLPWSGERSV